MIRSAKEAREIVFSGRPCPDALFRDAQMYLAALQGPECKALMEALKENNTCEDCDSEGCLRCEALAYYREAVKP